MTVLEALAVLEVATLQCQEREIEIDTPEVRDAFDLLEPYIRPEWLIPQFRYFLVHESDVRGEKEAQHHVLCTTFPVIRDSVKTLMRCEWMRSTANSTRPDFKIKEEIDRLAGERIKFRKPWVFVPPTLH